MSLRAGANVAVKGLLVREQRFLKVSGLCKYTVRRAVINFDRRLTGLLNIKER